MLETECLQADKAQFSKIANASNWRPLNIRMTLLEFGRQVSRSLSDDLQVANDGVTS